ncbi:DedA family protein [Pseudonocardia nigra]|uniref:DedA family protein n=1 Tax=Pseudonocardia nigra TaxID=1921578 RepID=UPI001C5F5FA6|nr:VTT domain-containing protein [Pseudonocardia nigra]
MTVLAVDWTDPSAIGYPAVFGGVLLGSLVPVVPTGAVVGAAAAIAMTTGHLSLPTVVLLATAGAVLGDLVTFGVAKLGGGPAVRWLTRAQPQERLDAARTQFSDHGWHLVVVGRLLPAGRIPVLVAAGALDYPWRRLVPAALAACLLWAIAYSTLGIVSGGLFDNPIVATLIAAVLVLVVGGVSTLVASRRRNRRSAARREGAAS